MALFLFFDNYYNILRIEPTASRADIKRAFNQLSINIHPDKSNSDTAQEFKKVNESYQHLINL